jgi:hypothetical protein
MKKVILAVSTAAVLMLSSGVNAAVYQMTEMRYSMSFITAVPYISLMPTQSSGLSNVRLAGACNSCVGGSAPVAMATTTAGAVSVTGTNWYVGNAPGDANGTEYTAQWDFTTNVGALTSAQNIIKSFELNTVLAGNFGSSAATSKSGFGGTITNGPSATQDKITVTEAAGQLMIKIQRALDNTTSGFSSTKIQSYTMVFTEVPVPGAAWLMGSGLVGLAGVARRRKMA